MGKVRLRHVVTAADVAEGVCGKVTAALALSHLLPCREQGISEGAALLLRLAQQMQSQALGCARTDAGQPFKLLDQPG